VLTDIKMPGMSGLELIREVSKFKEDVIFLIITGRVEGGIARDDEKDDVLLELRHLTDQLEPRHPRHLDVSEDQVEVE
ncbi:MAG: response regulator, partial [Deltaproteobacteria bacterium]